jgi:predicted ATPase
MDSIFYLGPLRDYPKRQYLLADTQPSDVGLKGEYTISAIRAMTTSGAKRNIAKGFRLRPFQETVAHWLQELGVVSSFRVEEIKKGTNLWQVFVKVREGASEVLLTDVGFGISQVLPVLTLLQYVPEGSTVILEQPEIHLHPLAQANLADAIINAALHRKVQVIVESHSEHLLLRLQRRVAEEVLSSEDVKLYFCDALKNKSRLVPLQLDMFGKIQNWPEKFMGDQFEETAAAEIARLDRMT